MSANEASFKTLTVNELQPTLTKSNYVVVDIRDAGSFANGRISGAIHLTNENISDFIREADPDAAVVVCCFHGISSQQAAQFLVSQDFTDVYSLEGGFTQWQLQFPEQIER